MGETRRTDGDGGDDLAIFVGMFDLMPDFKRQMNTAGQDGMETLCERFGRFFGYAKNPGNRGRGHRVRRNRGPEVNRALRRDCSIPHFRRETRFKRQHAIGVVHNSAQVLK